MLFLFMLLTSMDVMYAKKNRVPKSFADSLMMKVKEVAPLYEQAVKEYESELYLKGTYYLVHRNQFLRSIPHKFRRRKGVREYVVERTSQLNYKSPGYYDQRTKMQVGTLPDMWNADPRVPDMLHLNVYAQLILSDKLISPLAKDGARYYAYSVDSVRGEVGQRVFTVRFTPKAINYQLVNGFMEVSENSWQIRRINYTGKSETMKSFTNDVIMGREGSNTELLPVSYKLYVDFRFLGNHIDAYYEAIQTYYKVVKEDRPKSRRMMPELLYASNLYDLSELYALNTSTQPFVQDTSLFKLVRPVPQTPREQELFADYARYQDTLANPALAPKKVRYSIRHKRFWERQGDWLINRHYMKIPIGSVGSVRMSPIVNPLALEYRPSTGFTYRIDFKYHRLFKNGRLVSILPRVGWNITENEIYWRVRSRFEYLPRHLGAFSLEVGKGNRVKAYNLIDELKTIPEEAMDKSKMFIDFYRDTYFTFNHSIEIANGLTFEAGLTFHRRSVAEREKWTDIEEIKQGVNPQYYPILDKFKKTYHSLAPRVHLEWTPGMYYYMDGQRKTNLYSNWPTVSVEWEMGLSGLKNGCKYNRMEFDFYHHLKIAALKKFFYRFGAGFYLDSEDVYFMDYHNFRRSYLPDGWSDDLGGSFQVMRGHTYNSASMYLRANFMYDAPFLIMRHKARFTRYVLSERLYLNIAHTPKAPIYTELGYGIGTHVFDLGTYIGFYKGKYHRVGARISFELFKK